jgi:Uma2 family endonuclease
MSTQPKTLTPEEYLAIERKAEYKSEYFDGEMFAMSGAQREHNLIAGNLYRELGNCLRTRGCEFYPSDMRVRTVGRHYCYPDASVVCGPPEFLDGELDTLLNPSLIVEVLSPSTEAYDRGRKFERYQAIPSLRQYLLLASDRVHADLYVRQENGDWLLRPYRELADTVQLESIGCGLKLADLYEKVDFAAE